MMRINKRDFLKLAGLTAAGLSMKPLREVMAGAEPHAGATSQPGRRWVMVIDLREEREWTPVIEACHHHHNVPDFVHNPLPEVNNPNHEIKWIWLETYPHAFEVGHNEEAFLSARLRELKLPVLCNHCDNPPCVQVCPTMATFKRKDGIVAMDYHRCIGCRFCMAGCPYGSRSFNFKDPRLAFQRADRRGGWEVPNPAFPTRMKGVVEKCNFCAEHLERGLKPACVEASGGAIAFGDLNDPKEAEPEGVAWLLANNFAIKRKPELGTRPMVFYLV